MSPSTTDPASLASIGHFIGRIDALIAPTALLSAVLVFEVILFLAKRLAVRRYEREKRAVSDPVAAERISLAHFRRTQVLGAIHVTGLLLAVAIGFLIYDIRAFSFFAIAAGAVILTLKDTINSFLGYFLVLSSYDVGDDVRINGSLGEITHVRPTVTILAGKDENGEYNGQRIAIPNVFFSQNPVTKMVLKVESFQRFSLRLKVPSEASLPVLWDALAAHIEESFPRRTLQKVGNYKSFAGLKAKMDLDTDEKGDLFISISFIARPEEGTERKKAVITVFRSLCAPALPSKGE